MLYVYGIVRGGHPPPGQRGLGDPPAEVRVVTSGPIGAAVSDVPDDLELTEDDARAQLRVLAQLVRDGPVLPVRLGTAARDDEEVRRVVLDAVAADVVPRLDALDGLVELQLDVDDDESEALAAIADAQPGASAEAMDLDATIELGQRIADLLMAHRRQLADEVVGRLSTLSVANVPRSVIRGPEDPVLRWAFLVRRDDVPAFDEAVAALRGDYPNLAFRYVGPLPAAHFVDRTEVAAQQSADTFRGNGSWGW
jgi:hypothetical protein